MVEPPGLAELEAIVLAVTRSHGESPGVSVPVGLEDEEDAREFLTRQDVSRRAGASLSTIDRWIRSGDSPRSGRAVSAASPAATLTVSCLQRDSRWLRSATPEQIDRALEAGELNRLLGQPVQHDQTPTTKGA